VGQGAQKTETQRGQDPQLGCPPGGASEFCPCLPLGIRDRCDKSSSQCTQEHRQPTCAPLATQHRTPDPWVWIGRASVIGGFNKTPANESNTHRGEGSPGRTAASQRNALVKMCNERQNKSPISGKAVVKSLNDSGIFSGAPHGLL
jgi:hypothetical protein